MTCLSSSLAGVQAFELSALAQNSKSICPRWSRDQSRSFIATRMRSSLFTRSACYSGYPTRTALPHLKYVHVFLVPFDFLSDVLTMFVQEFEKDDDSNGHIDFITSASVS